MTSAARQMDDETSQHDSIVVLRGATWADYQRVLEIRGDRSAPRIAFSKGCLEIMSPSQPHEMIKSVLGCLVDVYCLERGIDFRTLGSWTLEDKAKERGIEPDECFVFSSDTTAAVPDLAIEVVWSSGGIDKLDAYRILGVREVWFWKRGRITPYVLRGDRYVEATTSDSLAGIDLVELASFVDRPTTSAAMREYRAALAAPARR